MMEVPPPPPAGLPPAPPDRREPSALLRYAPPFPPVEVLMRRQRRRIAIGLFAVLFLAVMAGRAYMAQRIPPARGLTGQPLPGLDPDPGDELWKTAPASAFTTVEWSEFARVYYSDTDQTLVHIPDNVRALHGRPVRMVGFMVALDIGDMTSDFIFVPNMARCYFCDTPDPAQSIYARGAFGLVHAENDRPVVVYGFLDVGVVRSGERLHSALRLRAVRIEPL